MLTSQSDTASTNVPMSRYRDKLNSVDFKWFVVRSLPHQERKLTELLLSYMAGNKNMLEVYSPTHTTASVGNREKDARVPLFAGFVFVLSTQQVVVDFIDRFYPEGAVLYDHSKWHGGKPRFLTIPEEQMRFFKDFNENFADKVIVLERPYSDYAFNPKTNEPNEIVKVVDGPLKGCEGYLTRFRRDKRLVFNMKSLDSDKYFAVSIPNIWSLQVVRLHNAENDRQTIGTLKERAVDLLVGMMQGCGYGDRTLPLLYEITDYLAATPTLLGLCQELFKNGDCELSRRIARLGTSDAELVLNLVRYEKSNPGYVRENWQNLVIRPFLTPTSGIEFDEGKDEGLIIHKDFTEIISKVSITELAYYPSKEKEETLTTTYFTHIGVIKNNDNSFTLFANWDSFLKEYFRTEGNANLRLVQGTTQIVNDEETDGCKAEKLVQSFRNYAPTLYGVLTDDSSKVRAVMDFKVGADKLNVLAVTTVSDTGKAKDELIQTCISICKEINTTTHLAVWRRYLRSVWLHD